MTDNTKQHSHIIYIYQSANIEAFKQYARKDVNNLKQLQNNKSSAYSIN